MNTTKVKLSVATPKVPPGINNSYGVSTRGKGKAGMYMKPAAKNWKNDFIMLTRSRKNLLGWTFDPKAVYSLSIFWWGKRHDNDAHVKLVQDALCAGAEFNDKLIKHTGITRLTKSEVKIIKLQYPDLEVDDREGLVAELKETWIKE
jgi:Holliday junction resolvase RusA-like endonuclease